MRCCFTLSIYCSSILEAENNAQLGHRRVHDSMCSVLIGVKLFHSLTGVLGVLSRFSFVTLLIMVWSHLYLNSYDLQYTFHHWWGKQINEIFFFCEIVSTNKTYFIWYNLKSLAEKARIFVFPPLHENKFFRVFSTLLVKHMSSMKYPTLLIRPIMS